MNAIEVRDVRKVYRRYGRRRNFGTLKSALLSGRLLRDLRPDETLMALNGVSFDVAAGRTFGIIGRNGSGKSTMLKLIAGIGKPTTGNIHVKGRVSALIELGAGFHPEISGRENVFINGMMLGLSRQAIAKRFDEIVAFAELEPFIDAPVKTYSSGMYMRLGFAVAINVDPDVLLVDEVLAVGDQSFTQKCLAKFNEFRKRGRTIVLVTHTLDMVARFCDEAIWLDHGQMRSRGTPQQVIDAYLDDVTRAAQAALGDEPLLSGVAIDGVQLVGADEAATTAFTSGDAVDVRITITANQRVEEVVVGFAIHNAEGILCCGTNTLIGGLSPQPVSGTAVVSCQIDRLDLTAGTYTVDVSVHRPDDTLYARDRRTTFTVASPVRAVGVFNPSHAWSFSTRPSVHPAGRT